MSRTLLLSVVWSLGLWGGAPSPAAQRADSVAARPGRLASDSLRVYLVTIGEGAQYWEKFGHNALWFYDPSQGIDVAYNWGTFDFAAPDFLRRILTGDTRYWVEGVPGQIFVEFYRQYDRTIVLQRLNFTAAQARAAYEYSVWNAREENKFYRYDYFRDNCSTRVRDVIDRALGGALKTWTASTQVDRTYRAESVRLVDDMKLVQFGIELALGEPADRRLSLWEDMFVPSRMRDALRDVRVQVAGTDVPLVGRESIMYQSKSHGERDDFPALALPYLIVGGVLALELLALGWAGRRHAWARAVFRVEAGVWNAITGLLGLVLLLAWLLTQHVFWYRNENLLAANPLSLWLAVVLALAVWRPRFVRPAILLAMVTTGLAGVALAGKISALLPQDNMPILLFLLPPHAAVAYVLWRGPAPSSAPAGSASTADASAPEPA